MIVLRKIFARQPWLMAVIVFALLAQIEQAIACEMMMDILAPTAGEYCFKHNTGDQRTGETRNTCCDLSSAHAFKSAHCNDDHETIINQSLAGKLNPNFHLALITVNMPDIFSSSYSTVFIYNPEQQSSLPGTQTYLATQRLRI